MQRVSGEAVRCLKHQRMLLPKAKANKSSLALTAHKYDWLMFRVLTTNCQQLKVTNS